MTDYGQVEQAARAIRTHPALRTFPTTCSKLAQADAYSHLQYASDSATVASEAC